MSGQGLITVHGSKIALTDQLGLEDLAESGRL
jgi:hypothetical protein